MIRYAAVPLLLGFIALLVFVYAVTNRRRVRARELRDRITEQDALLVAIQKVARDASDIDPSATLIDQMVADYRRKEIQ